MTRYTQQIQVQELGIDGQKKLAEAKVLVVGAGGLGTPCATYLAAAGIGTLGIVDGDRIAPSNLHRQFHYDPGEVGLNKATVLAEKLKRQNPDITLQPHALFVHKNNVASLLSSYDLICDCSDEVETRLLLDEYCAEQNKPLLYAAVRDWEGYLTVLNHHKKIRLTDIFPATELRENAALNCATAGIINSTCGTLGSLQAGEAIKIILGSEQVLDGEILCINTLVGSFRKFKVQGPL